MLAFNEILVYLLFAIIIVPLTKKFGFGSVLGYLLAGVIIGPLLGIVGADTQGIQHAAEFGVVMMLFLIGLELKPIKLWQMRNKLLGLGGLQVLLSIMLLGFVAWLFGNQWNKAIAIGMILALSSTAIVLQTLGEKGWLKTNAGQASFSILLFQDIAVIPILSILPVLVASPVQHKKIQTAAHPIFSSLPGWQHALIILMVFAGLIIIGRFVLNPIFKYVAQARILEIFTATILLLIICITLLMKVLGLSAALGTFLAGVLLSESEYRHEIESQVMPFKGLLLGIFFVSIGASINFGLLFNNAFTILLWLVMLLTVKFSVLSFLAYIFRYKKGDFWLLSLSLTQAGEFAFVLLAFAKGISLLSANETNLLFVVVALSMLTTPIFFNFFEKGIMPAISKSHNIKNDQIDTPGNAILVGVGRFGQIIARMLNVNNFDAVVIDHDASVVDEFRKYKSKVYYGNALKIEFLVSAGLNEAKLFIAATGNRFTQVKLVEMVKKYYPHVKVIARAIDRHHVYELEEAGADFVIRELFDASLEAAKQAMIMMGENPERAAVKAKLFKRHDEKTLTELKENWLAHGADKHYVTQTINKTEELRSIIQSESKE